MQIVEQESSADGRESSDETEQDSVGERHVQNRLVMNTLLESMILFRIM